MKLPFACLLGLAAVAGCSVINAPDDAVPPDGTGGSTSSAGGSTNNVGGSGGAGGAGMCGNGTVDAGEDCDDAGASATCDADCTPVECGDGTLNQVAGEACDDGNTEGSDACSAMCATTPFVIDGDGPTDSFTGILMQPSVAVFNPVADTAPEFWVAYAHRTPDLVDSELRVARYDQHGMRLGTELVLATGNNIGGASIAINDNGRALVTWTDQTTNEGRYSLIESDFTINGTLDNVVMQGSSNLVLFPSVASNGDGFCLQFTNENEQMVVRCFDNLGQSGSTQNQIIGTNDLSFINFYGAGALFARNNGYIALRYDTQGSAILGHELSSVGQTVGSEFEVGTPPSMSSFGGLAGNGVAASDGSFVVASSLNGAFGAMEDKFRATRRRFTAPAMPMGMPEVVSSSHTDEYAPWISVAGSKMLYTYSAAVGSISSECILKAQLFDGGMPQGPPQDVQLPGVEKCGVLAESAVNVDGDVFVVWVQLDQDDNAPVAATVRARLYPRLLAP